MIADIPAPPGVKEHAYNHPLGESGVTLFATAKMAAQYRRDDFPESLRNAPLLLPTSSAVLRRLMDQWMVNHGMHPIVVGEFDDSEDNAEYSYELSDDVFTWGERGFSFYASYPADGEYAFGIIAYDFDNNLVANYEFITYQR